MPVSTTPAFLYAYPSLKICSTALHAKRVIKSELTVGDGNVTVIARLYWGVFLNGLVVR